MTIILDNITKQYDGRYALKDFNVEIEWDKCYAFVGPKGCGKSTVLKVFMGDVKPDSGQVHRMGDYKYPTLHSAYVSQEGRLNPKKSAIWNVKKAHRWGSKQRAMEELSFFMSEERMNLPISELTMAERREVEIVKAFFASDDFIVFDEPFEGMDEKERKKALEYIHKNRGSRPFLIASESEQDLEFAKIIHMSAVS